MEIAYLERLRQGISFSSLSGCWGAELAQLSDVEAVLEFGEVAPGAIAVLLETLKRHGRSHAMQWRQPTSAWGRQFQFGDLA
jgi:hypothetical protein